MKTVSIQCNGPQAIGAKITTHEGHEVHGVRRAEIVLDASGAANVAKLEIVGASLAVAAALAEFHIIDPVSGGLKRVRRIEFADGTVFEA